MLLNSSRLIVLFMLFLLPLACGGQDGATLTPAPTVAPSSTIAPTSPPSPTVLPTLAPEPTPVPLPTTTTALVGSPSAPPTTLPATPTPADIVGELFLRMENPPEAEVIVEEHLIEVVGSTRVDALITVNDRFVEPDSDGRFASIVELVEGPNIIEVVTSVASGEETSLVLVVIYVP